ncbi:MAG TPA: cupin domain-containing protein [Bryobacteraceae bacterium]|nr:cupin domain-containing protein [Bryobacteraceae bacterium]
MQGIALFYCASVFAQAPGNTITPDPGITTTRLLDRPEVRVSRLEIEPGATRRVHAHDDVQFHLFVVLTGTVQVSIGSEQAEEGKPGKVFFLKKGTKHGFTNSGKTQATALEVFIKAGAAALDRDVLGLALAWAAAQTRCGGASLSSERPAAIDAGCVK